MFAKNLLTTRKRCTMQHMHSASLVFKVLRTQGIYANVPLPVMCLWERNFGASAELSFCCCRRCYYAIRNHVISSHAGGMCRFYAEMGKRNANCNGANFSEAEIQLVILFRCFNVFFPLLTWTWPSFWCQLQHSFILYQYYNNGDDVIHSHLELINTRMTFAEL